MMYQYIAVKLKFINVFFILLYCIEEKHKIFSKLFIY